MNIKQRHIVFLVVLFICQITTVFPQENKNSILSPRTRFIIIGINSYQHWDSLSYAENDAKEFYDFLTQNFNQGDPSSIAIFNNKEISSAQIINYVKKVIADTANFDQIIFYFAGHGSTQKTSTGSEEGFLIMPDAKANSDLWSEDAVASSDLLPRLSNLANTKKVYVILDACRTGSFSNSGFLSTGIYNSLNLIVACQKGESSYEDEAIQHGLFTYYLIEGLKGYADNQDFNGKVSLNELELFLRINIKQFIRSKKKPNLQTPLIRAPDLNDEVTISDPEILNIIKKKNGMTFNHRNYNHSYLNSIDTLGLFLKFKTFERNLIDGKLIDPEEDNAFNQYIEMKSLYPNESITLDMQYLLNTKLQSIGQKIINKYLSGEQISNIDSLEIISKYLEKSLAISDEFDSYYNRILAMQIFAQAVYISKDSVEKSIELLERALIIFPDASYICNELGHLYAIKENYIEATNKFSIALYYTPNWKIPNYNLGILYAKWDNQFDKSLVYLNRAIKIDPNYTNALHARGKIYFATGKYKNALKDLKKVIKLEPELKDELDVFIDESTKKLESKK